MNVTRRALVKAGAGAVATGGIAGCLDDVSGANADLDAGYAAFFTLWDWAEQVGGDAIEFRNPVGAGQPGHGWSPGGDLVRKIVDAGVFVYLDTPEFSWAQDVASTLEADYDTVTVIDALAGLDDQLLGWGHEVDVEDRGTDSGSDHGNESHDDTKSRDGHDHDRSSVDPHVWLDPVLARDMVDTIATGLADADPDNAATYEDNAAAYTAELESLDQQFTDLVAGANRRTGVLAGHDSFTYLQERYGFELHTPIGVSPQDDPAPNAIAETIDLVDAEGIDTILYDPFEAPAGQYPPLVDTILGESDATDAMAITHLSGTLAKWQEKGWGYLEQMQEINVPAFREALDAQ